MGLNASEVNIPRLIIAGVASGVGKTTVTAGIIAALRERGLRVQPFKCGPDYIDPSYLSFAAGIPCRNLDSWMLPEESLKEVFLRAALRADLAVVEGVMGLYDGRGSGLSGSTAEIAGLLQAPVILIIDVARMSGSAAAIALGYQRLDPKVRLAGVIFNNVGSPSHFKWAREAVEDTVGVRVFGYLPKEGELSLPERHLGLIPAAEKEGLGERINKVREKVSSTVDIEGLLDLARSAEPLPKTGPKLFPEGKGKRAKLAVALDKAFSFYYQDNLDLLNAWGAELCFVSPLHDRGLPTDIQGFYLGGGFPEIYAGELEANQAFKRELKEAAEAGMPIYAECGGLMYLSEGIIDFEGHEYRMAGLVPGWARMKKGRVRMGYALAKVLQDNILLSGGEEVRGHMFHWSKLEGPTEKRAAYLILEPRQGFEGFVLGPRLNILASYLHLHFASKPSLASNFIKSASSWGRNEG